jgi:hypothetical protein
MKSKLWAKERALPIGESQEISEALQSTLVLEKPPLPNTN